MIKVSFPLLQAVLCAQLALLSACGKSDAVAPQASSNSASAAGRIAPAAPPASSKSSMALNDTAATVTVAHVGLPIYPGAAQVELRKNL